MRISAELRYAADPVTAFAMIRETAFQERTCAATGATSYRVEVRDSGGGGIAVRTERVHPTDSVPDFVKSLVGASLRVTEVDEWGPAGPDGARDGTATVQIEGAPVRFVATLRLRPDGAASVQSVDGDLTASVPLLGSRVARAAEPAVRAAIRAQQHTADAWLADG